MGMPRSYTDEQKRIIGDRIRRTREALGLGQGELARMLGAAENTWNQYENGKRVIDPISLRPWLKLHSLTYEWIYDGDDSRLPYGLAVKLRTLAEENPNPPSSARRAKQKAAK